MKFEKMEGTQFPTYKVILEDTPEDRAFKQQMKDEARFWCSCGDEAKSGYYWQRGEHRACPCRCIKEHIHCEVCGLLVQVG